MTRAKSSPKAKARAKRKKVRKPLYEAPQLERVEDDFYVEERWATDLMLAAEPFGRALRKEAEPVIADPFCGTGNIPEALRAAGYRNVIATDLHDRGYPHQAGTVDFLQPNFVYQGVTIGSIVSNPPFDKRTILSIIRYCLDMAEDKVALFLPLKFLGSEGRYLFWQSRPPVRVYVLSSRPSCAPGNLLLKGKVKQEGGFADYCWYVWSRHERATGGPRIKFLITPEALAREHARAANRAAKAAKARAA